MAVFLKDTLIYFSSWEDYFKHFLAALNIFKFDSYMTIICALLLPLLAFLFICKRISSLSILIVMSPSIPRTKTENRQFSSWYSMTKKIDSTNTFQPLGVLLWSYSAPASSFLCLQCGPSPNMYWFLIGLWRSQ